MKKILISIIRFYRKYLSRLKGRGTCIYVPTSRFPYCNK
ncbi:membrane protein insertion efficiency factor YidD [Anaerostipes hadrus]|nr:membrane protein insertion efficiency factor YidD [Anaerostipes hadrus]